MIEHEPKSTPEGVPPAYWPASGNLEVKDLSAKYSEVRIGRMYSGIPSLTVFQDGPKVLHEISFEVSSGERVGIGETNSA